MTESAFAPAVHIVVINYNGWSLTDACLTSLQALQYENFRVVVVDNGSTDDSVEQLKRRWPNTVLLEIASNVGFTAANNVGTRWALQHGAEHVWFLNNDTTVDPHALSALVTTLTMNRKVGAVASVLYHMRDPGRVQTWGGGLIRLWAGSSRMHEVPVAEPELHFLAGTSLLVRGATLKSVGLLDERYFMYWEDAEFSLRLRRFGWKLAVAPHSRVWHLGSASLGDNSRTHKSEAFELHFTRSAVRFFLQHAPCPPVPILAGPGFYLVKRVLRGQWARARAVARGGLLGLRSA